MFRNAIILIALTLGLASCKPADTSATGSTTPEAVASAPTVLKDASLVCREIRDLNDIAPLSEVSVKIGEKTTLVDSISTCQMFTPEEYDGFKIPKNAVAACGGWWAGAGDYIYLVYEGNDAVVMAGWQAEEQEDEGFHYQEILRISRQ
jgi:hypothetical protein